MSGKQRQFRRRGASEEPEAEHDGQAAAEADIHKDKLLETRQLQQLRKRHAGVGADRLAQGVRENSPALSGPLDAGSSQAGEVMDAYVKAKSIIDKQDEDPHMSKYIEEQLALRLGKSATQLQEEENDPEAKRRKMEADLYTVPEDFRSQASAEASLPGMVATLTEVALAPKDKLQSIERTEALKRRMLAKIGLGTVALEEDAEAKLRETGKVKRGAFVANFGRQQDRKKTADEIEDELKLRKFIKDPTIPRAPRRG